MKKGLKKASLGLALLVVLLVGALLFVGLPAFNFTKNTFTQEDYRHIMTQNIRANPRVVDIAMLGAHDGFSNKIDKKSLVDPQEGDGAILRNKAAKTVAGGLFVRLAKAQKSSAYDLAYRGVRYFDVRITRHSNTWYTTHGLLSAPLEEYVGDLLRFLAQTQGEVIVFDMQHIWLGSATMEQLFNDMAAITYEGKSLFDYIHYSPFTTPLGELTYKQATAGGSGMVMLAKTPQYGGCFHYAYEGAIRSNWHNENEEALMLEGIRNEVATLRENPGLDRDKLRVNQAQMTGRYSPDHLVKTILGWSLLDMAENFNQSLVNQPDFSTWFETLPILMTDYSDSMAGGFNERAIYAINAFNQELN